MRWCSWAPPERARAPRPKCIAAQLAIPAISTGDIFRANVSGDADSAGGPRSTWTGATWCPTR